MAITVIRCASSTYLTVGTPAAVPGAKPLDDRPATRGLAGIIGQGEPASRTGSFCARGTARGHLE